MQLHSLYVLRCQKNVQRDPKPYGVQASTAIKKEIAIPSKKRVKGKSSNTRRTYLTCCTVDDEVFKVGDSAYALEQGQTYQV